MAELREKTVSIQPNVRKAVKPRMTRICVNRISQIRVIGV